MAITVTTLTFQDSGCAVIRGLDGDSGSHSLTLDGTGVGRVAAEESVERSLSC